MSKRIWDILAMSCAASGIFQEDGYHQMWPWDQHCKPSCFLIPLICGSVWLATGSSQWQSSLLSWAFPFFIQCLPRVERYLPQEMSLFLNFEEQSGYLFKYVLKLLLCILELMKWPYGSVESVGGETQMGQIFILLSFCFSFFLLTHSGTVTPQLLVGGGWHKGRGNCHMVFGWT